MLKSTNEWLPSMRAGCDNPGVQSLYKMLTVYAADYVWLGSALRNLALTMRDGDLSEINSEDRAQACKILPAIEAHCNRIELAHAVETIQYWRGKLQRDTPCTTLEVKLAIGEIERGIQNELSRVEFLYVERAKSEEYLQMVPDATPGLFDDPWPVAAEQLDHARRCYIADEFTASVFHSMRAAEKVLSTVAQSLRVESRRANWQNVIEGIESAAKDLDRLPKGDDREQRQAFYGEIAMQLRCIKNAWRNHVMHARRDYNEQQAREIWWHIKRTVDVACKELPESIED